MADQNSENVGWKGDTPTEIVTDSFAKGFIKPGDKVLDIGCGFGRNSNWLAGKGTEVIGININDEEIEEARKQAEVLGVKIEYKHADAVDLPFPDKSFSAALDLGCTHMLPDKEAQGMAEKEAARILAPGGYLIYFGFSKGHPDYQNKPKSPMFRDLEDIQEMYGQDFEIVSSSVDRWLPKPEENRKYSEHVGLNIVMRRKVAIL